MELILRKAKASETSFLQEFSREVINKNYRVFLGDEAVDFFIGSGASDQYVAENMEDTLVAELQDEVVGMCVCKENLIDLIMVRTDLHGQNIGSNMIAQVSAILFRKFDTIRLESFEGNTKANRFYEKNSWRRDKVEVDEEIGGNRIFYSKNRGEEFMNLKEMLIQEFNSLGIEGLHIDDLNLLSGSYVNLEYMLPSGQSVKLLDDNKVYWGNQIERPGDDRCFGIVADENYLLVCEYGCEGADPEIVLYKRR